MKKLSQINEGMFKASIQRSNSKEVRKEDEFNNIKKLKPVDMGGTVLWADEDLKIYDEYWFSIEDVPNLTKGTKWRLPTLEEVSELDNADFYISDNNYHLNYKGKELIFKKRGFWYHSLKRLFDDGCFYYGWTSTPYTKNNISGIMNILSFDNSGLLHTPENENSNPLDVVTQTTQDKLCVRLVQDK